jgi:hypothetical protein
MVIVVIETEPSKDPPKKYKKKDCIKQNTAQISQIKQCLGYDNTCKIV